MAHKQLIYVAHPYGGDEKNAMAVKQIIEDLTEGNHPMLANKIPAYHTVSDPRIQAISEIQANELMNAVYVSPIHQQGFMYEGTPYLTGLQKCLVLLSRCDMLLLCGNWKRSKGCMAELGYAMARHKPIIFEDSDNFYDLI